MSRSRHTADLALYFETSELPIYLLDDQRRIIYCNPACAAWTGIGAQELLGQQCAFHTPSEVSGPAAVAGGLCPPPLVLSGKAQTAVVSVARPDGQVVYRRGRFCPLGDGQDESAEVIAILESQDCPAEANFAEQGQRVPDAQLHEAVRRFRRQMANRYRTDSLIGTSPAIVRARAQIDLAAGTSANVLIVGPPGSGKESAARAIHYGQREPGTLVPLACALLETNLLRSTLRGLLQNSGGFKQPCGTLLLSEVDGLAGESQSELVELLRDRELPVRVIATTAKAFDQLVGAGQFSAELACALATITIELPPLSQRLVDLPLLAQALLEEINVTAYKQVGGFLPEALDCLAAYAWPANLDELAAVVRESHERACGGEVAVRDLPPQIHHAADATAHPRRVDETIVLSDFLARVEKELITRALRRAKGNKSKAAKLLGLTRPRLYRRLVQLGFEAVEDRRGS